MKRNCFCSAASHQTLKRSSRPFLNELEYVSLDARSSWVQAFFLAHAFIFFGVRESLLGFTY
jgi:hypothetical protein